MSDIAIRVENLSKRYRIGHAQKRYDTLRDQISDFRFQISDWTSRWVNRKSKIGNQKSDDTIWALKDVSFEIKRGEVVGIIGRNGAGKSTLLKILSRITKPTTGSADLYGRVGSLLEVGTGFHAELTGRENIYLSGAILGMRKAEIDRKFDEIVAFSEIEKFVDTPVKHFSSGMYVRLAFAVAAHLEPEILLVDEVLAVGDAAFQKKCLGKMGDVAKEGRTVLFVSHNMAAVESLCVRCILIDKGFVETAGASRDVIDRYLLQTIEPSAGSKTLLEHPGRTSGSIPTMTNVAVCSESGEIVSSVRMGQPLKVRVRFSCRSASIRPIIGIVFKDSRGIAVFGVNNRFISADQPSGHFDNGEFIWDFPGLPLMPGVYTLSLYLGDDHRDFDTVQDAIAFEVLPADIFRTGKLPPSSAGLIFVPAKWSVEPSER
jgi:lipopolysaccharide transport system ATP-binding protein